MPINKVIYATCDATLAIFVLLNFLTEWVSTYNIYNVDRDNANGETWQSLLSKAIGPVVDREMSRYWQNYKNKAEKDVLNHTAAFLLSEDIFFSFILIILPVLANLSVYHWTYSF